jgi:phage anti-repressor protein
MIYYPIYVREKVCKAIFELGHLISIIDHSERMREAREEIIKFEKKTTSLLDSFPRTIERKILAEYFHHQY